MGRSAVRELLAGQAQIGSVKFWATRANPVPYPRRVVEYTGVGVDGAVTEDLGRDARRETITATVEENIYSDLDAIKNEAKVVTIAHPLFGVFEGRLLDVTYEAGPNDMVDIVCTLVEHGDASVLLIAPTQTTASAKQAANSAFDNLGLDDLDGLADFPTSSGLPAAGAGMNASFASFSSVMEQVSSADALWTDVASAYNELASAGDLLIDTVDAFADATQDMVDMVDETYSLINVARDYVDAVERQVGTAWQDLQVKVPMSLAEIALDLIGDASEETIDMLLDRNPTIIDICAVPIGTALSIPVAS